MYAVLNDPFKYATIGNQMCVYGINASKDIYGYLYNQHAVLDANNITASGWSVPSSTDWSTLQTYLTTTYSGTITTSNIANHLKTCRQVSSPLGGSCDTTTHPRWDSNATHYGLDTFGFSSRPGGARGTGGSFLNLGEGSFYWTTSTGAIRSKLLVYSSGSISDQALDPRYGFSVKIFRAATSGEQSILSDGDFAGNYVGNDGKYYQTVKIGTQVWTVQALAETKWRNGTDITKMETAGTWATASSTPGNGPSYYCAYDNNETYV